MIGDASCVIRSIVRVSSPSSSSDTSCIRNSSVASSRTRCEDSLFCRMSEMAARLPTLSLSGRPARSSSSSSLTTSVGSAQMIVSAFSVRRSGTKTKRSIHSTGIERKRSASTRNDARSTNCRPSRSASARAWDSPSAPETSGPAAIFAVAMSSPLSVHLRHQAEDRQVHGEKDRHDDASHDDQDDRLDERDHPRETRVDLLVVELRDGCQHLLEGARRLADFDHFDRQVREEPGLLEGPPELAT